MPCPAIPSAALPGQVFDWLKDHEMLAGSCARDWRYTPRRIDGMEGVVHQSFATERAVGRLEFDVSFHSIVFANTDRISLL